MDLYNVFLSFGTPHTRKSFSKILYTFIDDEEQSDAAVVEDFVSSQLEDLRCIFVAPGLYLDEIVDISDQGSINHRMKMKWSIGAFSKEMFLVSGKYGSVNRGEHDVGTIQSWKNDLVEAAALDALTVEVIRNLAAKMVNEIPRSVLSCYVDSFSNSQMRKAISWKGAATDAVSTTLNISVCGEFSSFVSIWKDFKLLDLHLASSTRQPKPCPKMFSNASKLPFISLLNSGSVNGMDTTYNRSCGLGKNDIKMNIIDQSPPAHPPPENDIYLKNNHMTRETSMSSLLITICMVTTFVTALGFSSTTFKDAYSTSKDLITSRLIIAINTLVFIVSLVMDMFLLHKSTYKWELQITLFALFGAYICLMKVMVPQAAFPLFLLSVPFLFFAAA